MAFTDDVVIFGEASKFDARNIHYMLELFFQGSCQNLMLINPSLSPRVMP